MEVSSARGGLMARYGRLLTDAQWGKIQPLLPKRPKRPRGLIGVAYPQTAVAVGVGKQPMLYTDKITESRRRLGHVRAKPPFCRTRRRR